ncbi:YiiX/YebB-like N1pC/P60 family cysteine hydrolase [Nitrospira sp. Nam74]
MAYDANTLKNWAVTDYATVRPDIRSGDLIFCSGQYLVSKAIEEASKSLWSHIGILLRVNELDRVILLESVEDMGVRLAPVSKYLTDYDAPGKPYNGTVYLARYQPGLSESEIKQIATFGLDKLTRPYNREEIAAIAARIALHIPNDDLMKNDTYICSELVYACFQKAGITFPLNPGNFISPEDIAKDPRIQFLYRIR